jgi:hypothetical protein
MSRKIANKPIKKVKVRGKCSETRVDLNFGRRLIQKFSQTLPVPAPAPMAIAAPVTAAAPVMIAPVTAVAPVTVAAPVTAAVTMTPVTAPIAAPVTAAVTAPVSQATGLVPVDYNTLVGAGQALIQAAGGSTGATLGLSGYGKKRKGNSNGNGNGKVKVKVVKKASAKKRKVSKIVKTRAKKLGIKLTLKRGDKRVAKSETILKKQISKKVKAKAKSKALKAKKMKMKMKMKMKTKRKLNVNVKFGSSPARVIPFQGVPHPGYSGITNYFPDSFNYSFYPSPSPNKRMLDKMYPM